MLAAKIIREHPSCLLNSMLDQRNQAAFGITYSPDKHGLWATFSGLYQSGVPVEVDSGQLAELEALPGSNLVTLTADA